MTLAVLLAAGRGRRLGGPKAWTRLGDRSFLEHATATLLAAGVDAVTAVVPGDTDPAALPAGLVLPDAVTVLPNPDADRGQTTSVQRALAEGLGAHELFLLHTVDRPLVRAADVVTLLQAWAARPPGVNIVVPSVDGRRGHPALFHAALAQEFLDLAPDEPAHRVLRRDPDRVHHVVLTDRWLVRDVDTPGDLADAEASWQQQR